MPHQTRFLIVVALVLLAAGVAAAQSMLAGPSPGIATDNTTVAQSTTPGSTSNTSNTTTPTSPSGTTGTTPGSSTGSTTGGTTPTPTPAPSTPTTTTPGATVTSGMTVDQIVSLIRTVDASVPAVSAFTVPAGRLLVVTDVLVTNIGTAPACGASISAGGATAAPTTPTTPGTTTPGAAPAAATSESGTGALCVPAQTSLNVGLTTGLEFAAGQNVVLGNAPPTGGGALHYHLRGFLATPSGA